MIQELKDIFPHITEYKIWKILLTIKFRYIKYWTIWISRLEASRFWLSERQLYSFIKYLREVQAIKKYKMAVAINGFKCNVYKVSKWFSDGLNDIKEFIKKKFEYINPLEYVKARFVIVKEWSKLKFKVNWNRYIIHTRWRFKNVIYDVWNNCIISPLTLTN